MGNTQYSFSKETQFMLPRENKQFLLVNTYHHTSLVTGFISTHANGVVVVVIISTENYLFDL